MDGVTLSEGMHTRGINIRYLGKIANMLAKVKQLEYLLNIAVAELLTRTAKHVFTTYMQVRAHKNKIFKNISFNNVARKFILKDCFNEDDKV